MEPGRVREFEELVLLCVLIEGDGAYGVSIQGILEEELGRSISLGAIYTALNRLSGKGWIRSEMGEPTAVRGGRRKRHYTLTREGLIQVREVRRLREALWARVHPDAWQGGGAT